MTAYRGEDIFVKMLLVFGILAAFVDRTIKLGVVAQNSGGGNLGDVNISALLTSFQTGYDKRVRPNYGGKRYRLQFLFNYHNEVSLYLNK